MQKINRRTAIHNLLLSLDKGDNIRRVMICYMLNYSEIDIREELKITKRELIQIRNRIKKKLVDLGIS